METLNNQLRPLLEDFPFFEDDEHCQDWVDDTLCSLKFFPSQDIPKEMIQWIISDLEYSQKILTQNISPRQADIKRQFQSIMWDITHNERNWDGLDHIYSKIYTYINMKKAAENQF